FILKDFQQILQVSRNTVINDIKVLKKELKANQIKLEQSRDDGYVIIGDEVAVRFCLIRYLSEVISQDTMYKYIKNSQDNLFQDTTIHHMLIIEEIQAINHYLGKYETLVEIEITDDVRNNLIICFYFFIQRITQRKYAKLDAVEKEVIHTTEEFLGAKKFCENLSIYFNIDIPMREIIYFTKYLLSAKVNYDLNIQPENDELKNLT